MTKNRVGLVVCASGCALIAAAPTLACPGVRVCIPSSCLSMHARVQPPVAASGARGGFAAHNVTLLAQVPLWQMGANFDSTGSSLHAWVDPQTQREYAIMGRSNGTAIIDVTVPTAPVYVANIPMANGSVETLWREPKVIGNTLIIGADGTNHPMQTLNLGVLRNYSGTTMQLTPGVYAGPSPFTLTRIHTLAVNPASGYAYASGSNVSGGGLYAIDMRLPAQPRFAGTFADDGYTHESQVVIYNGPDAQYQGREIAFNSNGEFYTGGAFSILDVTNKSAMTRIAKRTYANAGYIHQGWLTEDHRYFFQDDELDEVFGPSGAHTRTHLWDVSDLDNPVYRGYFEHQTTSIDHNLYVKDGFVYQTNYTTGLRILKIGDLQSSNPQDWLSEVAYFDTYPWSDEAYIAGAWNNYPFLPSGNILVSDIDSGLFILRAEVPEPAGFAAALALTGAATLGRRRSKIGNDRRKG